MRLLSFSALIIFCISCGHTKNLGKAPAQIQGTWLALFQEIGGTKLPAAYYEHLKMVLTDSTYIVYAESVDKGIVRYSRDNKLDIYGKEGVNAGKHFTGIYKFENGVLAVCYNLKGDVYPDAFDTKGKPLYFLAVFRKE